MTGDPQSGRFGVIYQNADRITAIQCVNAPVDFAAAKKMVAERRAFPPALLCNSLMSLRDIRLGRLAAEASAT